MLNPLEKTGFIDRLPDPNDRRVVRIGLTDKGSQQASVLIVDAKDKMVKLVNLLGEEDSKTFIRLTTTVISFFTP